MCSIVGRCAGGLQDASSHTPLLSTDYLTKQVRSLVPYLLRYAFYRNHVHYVTLRKPWKYYSTAVWTAKCAPPRPFFPARPPARHH